MSSVKTALIIGGSHTAAQLAPSLRQEGWQGKILVVSDEAHLPYHRPPLSKAYLSGEKEASSLLIRSQAMYEKFDIDFLLNTRVEKIDREQKTALLDNNETIHYDKLAFATGARVRHLPIPGADLKGVHYLRNLADAEAIKQQLKPGVKAVIVGGGYIGLETAALLRKIGVQVCVLETMNRVLERVTCEQISQFYTRVHRGQGVDIKTGVMASEIVGTDRAEAVVCHTGERVEADLVIIGIGVIPNTELAESIGLEIDNGLLVDEYACTADVDIVAAGDVTNHPNPMYGRTIRLESVPNATEQAKSAAASMCGKQKAYSTLPWFWSDQYDLKLQIAGLNQGYDRVAIRGDIKTSQSFVVWYLKDAEVIAADCINRPLEFMLAKQLIASTKSIAIEQLIDEHIDAKQLMAKLK